ncbi:ParB/RepB/Spo0J family partition protein [Weissella sp. GP1]|uniref:ParB/RepB/Spo0J family partition protein n=2 Tax=Weissella TaxID=46255 RepID=A0AAJ3DAG6_WEICO|nr:MULTISPECIES: ParB/RepB/Spo0J family partition protein [Weissella]MBJ7688405.1 ParB/RepB/Spo0J family partition protein [Weissella confusa]MBJ7693710.1 ParB/RepB/Spo0J family partition protein [Weissella confusa]MCW0926749.1 ParB/RepB/Spo0J family partition protein [Weissella sp. LMG 11983]MDF9299181.1 ParB/RepB/Spo0J family partition protein [Weissella sp. BK2]NBA10710.1 ParB/RepB/Spo0J family partition protein [Weissella confusa]
MANTKKSGLGGLGGNGGGLGALFAEQGLDTEIATNDTVRDIAIDKIVANPFQPRHVFDQDALQDLAASIKENGVLQPVIVRHNPKDNTQYELLAGERRWRASQLAGKKDVPAIVRKLDDEQMMQAAILENLQREDLTPLEEAQAYRDMMDALKLTQEQVAKRLGKARSAVANFLRLLNLPDEVKDMLQAGQLSMGQARTLLGLRNKRRIVPVAKRAIAESMTVRQLEQLVNKLNEQADTTGKGNDEPSAYLKATTAALEDKFGTKVNVTRNRKGAGKIEIAYLSDDDLNRIFDVLGISFDEE